MSRSMTVSSRVSVLDSRYAPTWLETLRQVAVVIGTAVIIAQATRAFAFQPFIIPSGSMLPTIQLYDQVVAERITYELLRQPVAGDIVVFDNPDHGNKREKYFIKRIVAVEGQTVDIRDGRVWVDGSPLDEPYVHGARTDPGTVTTPVRVPKGYVWLMGDNRPGSGDSRYFGPQPVSAIHARAVWTYWPLEHFGSLD